MAAASDPLPDFNTLGESFNTLRTQFQRFANLPAVQDGQVLHMLVQQNQQILQRLDTLTERVDSLHDTVDRLESRTVAEHANSLSRMCNNTLRTPERLEVLYDITTNEPIDNFPETVEGIQALNMANANRILTALGHDPHGTLTQKKRRILLEAGITQQLTNVV